MKVLEFYISRSAKSHEFFNKFHGLFQLFHLFDECSSAIVLFKYDFIICDIDFLWLTDIARNIFDRINAKGNARYCRTFRLSNTKHSIVIGFIAILASWSSNITFRSLLYTFHLPLTPLLQFLRFHVTEVFFTLSF